MGAIWSPANFGTNVPGSAGQVATGTNQATAFQLTQQVTVFSTVASGTGCALPSSFASGSSITIVNRGTNALAVYPSPQDEIEVNGIGVSVSVPTGGSVTLTSFDPPASPPPRTWWETAGYNTGSLSGFLPLSGGNVTGPLLVGTGQTTLLPYQFQVAINADPSTLGAVARQTIFNTTLNFAADTDNDWEGLASFVTVNGPGKSNGEINGAHVYGQFNAGSNIAAWENYEASLQNSGTIGGTVAMYLVAPHNTAGGIVSGNLLGIKSGLQNDNTTVGEFSVYFAIDNEAMAGAAATAGVMTVTTTNNSEQINVTGVVSGTFAVGDYLSGTGITPGSVITSLGSGTGGDGTYNLSNPQTGSNVGVTVTASRPPTFYGLLRNDDYAGNMVSLGGITLGSLSAAVGTLLAVKGLDNNAGSFPVVFENESGTKAFFVDNAGDAFFGNGATKIDASGNLTAVTALSGAGLANTIQMVGHSAGAAPTLQTNGTDSVVGMNFNLAKGTTGSFIFSSVGGNQFAINSVVDSVSFLQVAGAAVAANVLLDVDGTGTGLSIGANIATSIILGQAGVPTVMVGELFLGSPGATAGAISFRNATSGSITLSPTTGALGTQTLTLPDVTGTVVAGSFTANGAVATALTSVGPTGAHSTVQEWLTITDAGGTVRYIPCF